LLPNYIKRNNKLETVRRGIFVERLVC
jgi:hypothetical protein